MFLKTVILAEKNVPIRAINKNRRIYYLIRADADLVHAFS